MQSVGHHLRIDREMSVDPSSNERLREEAARPVYVPHPKQAKIEISIR